MRLYRQLVGSTNCWNRLQRSLHSHSRDRQNIPTPTPSRLGSGTEENHLPKLPDASQRCPAQAPMPKDDSSIQATILHKQSKKENMNAEDRQKLKQLREEIARIHRMEAAVTKAGLNFRREAYFDGDHFCIPNFFEPLLMFNRALKNAIEAASKKKEIRCDYCSTHFSEEESESDCKDCELLQKLSPS